MRYLRFALPAVLGVALLAGPTHKSYAGTVVLGFNSLPSAQGWSFNESAYVPESSLFSVGNQILHQNTMGQGQFGADYSRNVELPNTPFTIAATLQVTSEETFYGGIYSHTGVGFGANINGFEYFIAMGPGAIVVARQGGPFNDTDVLTNGVDTTRYHSYLLEGTTANGAFSLLVDGQLIGSGIGAPADPSVNNLFFGDGSSRANAIGDYTALVYTAGVPESTTWVMMVIGFCLIGLRLGQRPAAMTR